MHPALARIPSWAAPFVGPGKPGRGIINGLPEDQYHGTRALISKSALDLFAVTPRHFHYSLDAPEETETDAMRIGTAFHIAALEPDLFDKKVTELPDFGPMQSSKNRAARDAWIEHEAAGMTWLKQHEMDVVLAMAKSVREHPAARKLLRNGHSEVTAVWTDPHTGLPCKSRADFLSEMNGVFVDLKSAVSASPDAFKRAVGNCRYHVQDAMYSRAFEENGIHIEHFAFVVVEKTPPYAVGIYTLDDTAKLRGEELYMRELRQLRACIDEDRWPSYNNDRVADLSLPPWVTSPYGEDTDSDA